LTRRKVRPTNLSAGRRTYPAQRSHRISEGSYAGKVVSERQHTNMEQEKTILLVEDEASIALSEEITLGRHGYKVISAFSGEEAVETFSKSTEIDLVLMDIDLGTGMDGARAAEIILKQREIPLIFLSAHSERDFVAKTEGITSYGYVVKNSGEMVLIASIKMAFRLFDSRKKEMEKDAALHKSEERFSLAMDAATDGIWDWNVTSGETYYSPGCARMLGYSPGKTPLDGGFWLTLIHPEDKDAVFKANKDCVENLCSTFKVEYRMQARNGAWRWILGRGTAVERDPKGRAVRIIGTHMDITDYKRTEEALLRERNLLHFLINGAKNSSLAYLDREFNYIRVNETYAATCGYRPEEMIGKNHFDLYPHSENEAIFARVRDTGEPFEARDKPFLFPDQPERGTTWRDWTLCPVNDPSGQVAGLVISLFEKTNRKRREETLQTDIAERRQMEEKLRLSEEKYRSLVESTSDCIWEVDANGCFTYLSPKFQDLLGYAPEEFLGRAPSDLIPENERPQVVEEFLAALANRQPFSLTEHTNRHRDGRHVTVEVRGIPLLSPEGECRGLRGITRDITERKAMKDALREKEEMNRLLVDNLNNAVVYQLTPTSDGVTRFTYVSRAVERLNECSAEEVLADAEVIYGQVLPEYRALVREREEEARKNSSTLHVEVESRLPSGRLRWFEYTSTPRRRNDGQMVWDGVQVDITERKQAEEALKTAYEEKQYLLRELQHRAKNSFSMIGSLISLMGNSSNSDEAKSALNEIGSRVLAISSLYDLLNANDSITMVRLDEYIGKIASSLPGISENITLQQACEAITLPVKIAIPLGIIITELITNSIKYAFPDGRCAAVTLSLKKTDDGATIEVSDDGIGLPEGFDLSSISTLGLNLVTILAKQINGNFTIEGRQGTRCVLEFPL